MQYLEKQWWPKFVLWTNLCIEGLNVTCESNQTIEGSIMVSKKQEMDGKTEMRVDEYAVRRYEASKLYKGKACYDFTNNLKKTDAVHSLRSSISSF